MSCYYHVDRLRSLQEGDTLSLQRWTDVNPQFLQEHVDSLFPEGLTRHGEQYLLRSTQSLGIASPRIELLWGYVRRASFPDRPSRYQSVFGWESEEDAGRFNVQYASDNGAICELDCDEAVRADMTLLCGNMSALVSSYFAHLYWEGKANPDEKVEPLWEVLLRPPVRVLRVA